MAWLVSSVASAKYSALPASPPNDETSDTGLASQSDSRPSDRVPGPTTVAAVRERDHRGIAVEGRGGAEELGATTCGQDPSRALVPKSPLPVAGDTVSRHLGSLDRLTLQGLHWITPQAHDLHDCLRICCRPTTRIAHSGRRCRCLPIDVSTSPALVRSAPARIDTTGSRHVGKRDVRARTRTRPGTDPVSPARRRRGRLLSSRGGRRPTSHTGESRGCLEAWDRCIHRTRRTMGNLDETSGAADGAVADVRAMRARHRAHRGEVGASRGCLGWSRRS